MLISRAMLSEAQGSLPFRLRWHDGAGWVDWCDLGDVRLKEPFFDQTVAHRLRQNPESLRTTPLEALFELGREQAVRSPSAFLFHSSRCGSTLITRMLAGSSRFDVFSEPEILETVLRNRTPSIVPSSAEKRALLGGLVRSFVEHRPPSQGVFLKTSARAIEDYELLVATFPQVPRVFVYREPVEVLVSLVGSQAERLPPALEHAGLLPDAPEVIRQLTPPEFWARVLARQFLAALAMSERWPTLLLNYRQLPTAVWEQLANHCGLLFAPRDIENLRAVATESAKNPGKLFRDDGPRKNAAASAQILALAERWVRPLYERLEARRLQP